jgi:uncharacterized protein (TIRG00374 family)
MRRLALVVGSILVSMVFLYFALQGIPLDQIWARIQTANFGWLLISFGFVTLALWTRAERWRAMLPNHTIDRKDAFYIIGVTFILNLLPLRAGEVARSLLARRHGVPFVTAATSVVVERLLDMLTVIVMLVMALTQIPNTPPDTARIAATFGIIAVTGFVVLLFFARFPRIPHLILEQAQRILPVLKKLPLTRLLDNVLAGLEPLTHWRLFAVVMFWNIAGWLTSLAALYCLHPALDIGDIPVLVSTLLGASLASFSIAIPLSVASIGPFEAALLLSGQLVGLDDVRAFSLGLVYHGVAVFGYVVWGLVGFAALGVSLGDILSAGKRKNEDEPTPPVDA